jgi:hypothetical protein
MPAKKTAVSRKRAAIAEEILRVAADKFGKHGYQATTLDEIATAAGISRAAFYLYSLIKKNSYTTSITTSLPPARRQSSIRMGTPTRADQSSRTETSRKDLRPFAGAR